FGIHLTIAQQISVCFVCVLGGIGTAGVPAGSIPVVVMILGMVGVPPEGIGMILGVDRFLDMCRTTLNVTGDLAAAVVVSRGGGGFAPGGARFVAFAPPPRALHVSPFGGGPRPGPPRRSIGQRRQGMKRVAGAKAVVVRGGWVAVVLGLALVAGSV